MNNHKGDKPVQILLVEDNPGDVDLIIEAFEESKIAGQISTVEDGATALTFLHQEGQYAGAVRPDMILLDLNLPGVDGFEVLAEVKQDERLQQIPVIVMTTSEAERDILKSYQLHANAYVTKPIDIEQFIAAIKAIEGFWLTFVKLL